ncbi:MAG TPA: hypothetical protein VMW31_06495, partial [Devosiaceae bacterium]|nr:hypothetical protein [Devosiaceae bacterium]
MKRTVLALIAISFSAAAAAQDGATEYFSFGGDEYAAGQTATVAQASANDAFAAGFDVRIAAPVGGDAHAAGFNVTIDSPVTGNVYAGGFSVTIGAPVGEDVTAAGNSVTVLTSAAITGNARLAGQTVTLTGPVEGSVLIAGETATLGSVVSGDMQFTGVTLNFAAGARVDGTLTIRAPREITVPASVATADRVVYRQLEYADRVSGPAQVALETVQQMSPWVVIVPVLIWNLVLLVIGLVCFALFARRSAAIYEHSLAKPWYTGWVGLIGLAVLFGGFVALGMTLIGIPLIPLWLLAFVLMATLAQVAGAFILGGRILAAFPMTQAPIVMQMIGLLIGLVVLWVLGLVPFLGYLVWLGTGLVGLGGILRSFVEPGGSQPIPAAMP